MKQGFPPVSLFENGKELFPIFSAQITVASPKRATESLMENGKLLIVNEGFARINN